MNKQLLKGVLDRLENRPEADQEELLEYALEIEARHEAEAGRFASDEEVEAVFAKFRDR